MSNRLLLGIFWSVIEVAVKRLLDLGVKLILMRLLFPEDFGIVGMATVFTAFFQVLGEAGTEAVIIQKKELTTTHINTLFWSNLLWSLFLYIVVAGLLTPFIASFNRQPVLTTVIPVLSLSLITGALNVIQKAQLMRKMAFKKIAFVQNLSTLTAGVIALMVAHWGGGIWAIVIYTVVAGLVSIPLFWMQIGWMPKIEYNTVYLKDMLTFFTYTMITQAIINIVSNTDSFLIGSFMGAAALGIYSLAFMMTVLVKAQITSMVNRVMFPFYSREQEDISTLKNYYIRLVKFYALVVYPVMLTLILFGEKLINFMFGTKWQEAALPLKILAFGVLISVLTDSYNGLFRSTGKAKQEMRIQTVLSVLIYLPCTLIGFYCNGYIGVAYGTVIAAFINAVITQLLLSRYFGISFVEIFRSLRPALFSSVLASSVVVLLKRYDMDVSILVVCFLIVFLSSYSFMLKKDFKLLKRKLLNN